MITWESCLASSYEQMRVLSQRLRLGPATVDEIVTLLAADRRTVFRYLARLEKNEQKDFRKKRGQGRACVYWLDAAPPMGQKVALQLDGMRKELAEGGNHRFSNLLKQAAQLLSPSQASADVINPLQSDAHFHLDHGPLSEYDSPTMEHVVSQLLRAIHAQNELQVAYRHAGGKDESFLFRPLSVLLRVGRLYLVGVRVDQQDKGIKVLLVKRIHSQSNTGRTFKSIAFLPQDLYRNCFGAFLPESGARPQTIHLELLDPWVATLFRESHFDPAARIWEESGSIHVELMLHILPDFVSWLMGLLPDIRVLRPASLAKKLERRCLDALESASTVRKSSGSSRASSRYT